MNYCQPTRDRIVTPTRFVLHLADSPSDLWTVTTSWPPSTSAWMSSGGTTTSSGSGGPLRSWASNAGVSSRRGRIRSCGC
jgi:hypothetical protein